MKDKTADRLIQAFMLLVAGAILLMVLRVVIEELGGDAGWTEDALAICSCVLCTWLLVVPCFLKLGNQF